jgi:hypothetical protein
MPTPIVAFAVRTASGDVTLKLTQSAAELYAVQHHGTVHRLVEWIEPLEQPPHRTGRPPQADSGLIRI